MSNVECQRFFAFSKRVPKDVKRFCGICRQHGKLEETRGHICEFKDCECQKCNLVRSRRLVMSQQIRLRRAQDKRFQRTTEPEEADVVPILSNAVPSGPDQHSNAQAIVDAAAGDQQQLMDAKNMCYFCQKCKNHGILVWKKQHKRQCPFTNCTCDFCELIETRRRLDQHIKRRKSEPQSAENGGDDKSDESDESVPRKKSTASLPAQIEAMTMAGGSSSSAASSVSNAFWRASPPGGAGLSIPIGIAQNRIAEQPQEEGQQSQQAQETPLDALAAQISRIQQNSPEQHSRQSPASSPNFGIPMSATSSPPPALAPMVPSAAPTLDQQQQILLNQLLLSSDAAASILPIAGIPMASADFSALAGAAPLPQMFGGGMEQILATAAAAAAASSPSQSPAQNDALLGQFLLHCMAGQQQQMMGGTEMKPQAQIPLGGAIEGAEQQHRELLLQIIAQLLQDQHLSDQQQQQQQAAIQQQQKTLMDALMMANLGGIGGANPLGGIAELQQLVALQSDAANGGIDPALLATSLLMTQHQQQQQQEMFKDAALLMPPTTTTTESEIGNNKRQSQSPPEHHHHHQSAFTALRPGTFGGLP